MQLYADALASAKVCSFIISVFLLFSKGIRDGEEEKSCEKEEGG